MGKGGKVGKFSKKGGKMMGEMEEEMMENDGGK